jgi:hypothetical protein
MDVANASGDLIPQGCATSNRARIITATPAAITGRSQRLEGFPGNTLLALILDSVTALISGPAGTSLSDESRRPATSNSARVARQSAQPALISLLAIKGRQDGKNFIKRISDYEAESGVSPIRPKKLLGIDSLSFTITVSILLALLNIYLILFTLKFSSYHSLLNFTSG